MSETPIVTMRLNPDLSSWVTEYAKNLSMDRSALVRELLDALRDRRLVVFASAAPHSVNNGSDPAYPVLVCHKPN